MALNAEGLKSLIQQKKQQHMAGIEVSDPANADQVRDANNLALAEAIFEHILSSLTVTLPVQQVITSVTGQAVGMPNPAPIDCEVE